MASQRSHSSSRWAAGLHASSLHWHIHRVLYVLACCQLIHGLHLVLLLQEQAELALCRTPGLPPFRVVTEMPESDGWAAVTIELPFAAVNDMLGVQLDRRTVRGVHSEW